MSKFIPFLILLFSSYCEAGGERIFCKMHGKTEDNIFNNHQPSECSKSSGMEQGFADKVASGQIESLLTGAFDCNATEKKAVSLFSKQINPLAYKSAKDVAKSNKGLIGFFKGKTEATENNCFGALAFRFYQKYQLDDRTASFKMKAGAQMDDPALKKGDSVWNDALKFSGGDKNLAMALIGVCGHDDNVEVSEQADHTYCLDKIDLGTIDSKCGMSGGVGASYTCPKTGNKFHSQGGLDGLEIPQSLKQDLATMRGQSIGNMPHKYYHIYASSYFTCQMMGDKLSPEKAANVDIGAAMVYRSLRVCDMTN